MNNQDIVNDDNKAVESEQQQIPNDVHEKKESIGIKNLLKVIKRYISRKKIFVPRNPTLNPEVLPYSTGEACNDDASLDKNNFPVYPPDLKRAYELLNITYYPVTEIELINQYYFQLLKNKPENMKGDEWEAELIKAKNTILDNLDVSPFEEPESISIASKSSSNIFKRRKQKKWKDFISELEQPENTVPLTRRISKKMGIGIIVVVLIGLIYAGYLSSPNGRIGYLSEENSLLLLERDGLILEGIPVNDTENKVLDYTCSNVRVIPGINLFVLKYQFMLINSTGKYKIKGYSLYHNRNSIDDFDSWERLSNINKISEKLVDLSGEWRGDYIIPSKNYSMYNIQLMLNQTPNGFLYGQMAFSTEKGHHGEVLVEGKVDIHTMMFQLNGIEWVERPYLFQMPSIIGVFSIPNVELQHNKFSNEEFTLSRAKGTNTFLEKVYLEALLETQTATLVVNDKSYDIPLKGIEITTVIKNPQDTSEYKITGTLKNSMFSYQITGLFKLSADSKPYMDQLEMKATIQESQIVLDGKYTGIEYINGESYHAEYKIYSKADSSYFSVVTLRKVGFPIKKQIELRRIYLTDTGIQSKREDIIYGEAPREAPPFADFDYVNEGFYQKGVLELKKDESW